MGMTLFLGIHMAEYDTISKHLIQNYPDDLVQFILGRVDVEVDGLLETEQPTCAEAII